MMTKFFLCLSAFAFCTFGGPAIAQEPIVVRPGGPDPIERPVTAAEVVGVYRGSGNEFRVIALSDKKIKLQFNPQWMTGYVYPNPGEATAEATIEGKVATFIPAGTTKCKVLLTFLRNRLEVTQEGTDGDCDFGRNVMATGTYRRIKGGHPRLVPVIK